MFSYPGTSLNFLKKSQITLEIFHCSKQDNPDAGNFKQGNREAGKPGSREIREAGNQGSRKSGRQGNREAGKSGKQEIREAGNQD
ncbi:hypothetical protein KKF34_19270 [Myxococcota bacterium]|nr:hypothetical protein [Myxococcota bacterium]MBU1382206.1 hypothetical protein [Myxococcota bacterium]MBU1499030.1 hypothetical protein [Myxococcota bacterium]